RAFHGKRSTNHTIFGNPLEELKAVYPSILCRIAISLQRFPSSACRVSLYIMAGFKGRFWLSKGMTVPEVEVTETAIMSFFLIGSSCRKTSSKQAITPSHHRSGFCAVRKSDVRSV